MSAPAASILLCVYNRGRQAQESVRSLLRMDRQDFEIILVDDASTDDTLSYLDAMRQENPERVVVARNGVNRGVSGARNAGLEAARGEFVLFIDSDCTVDPAWLGAMLRGFDDRRVAAVAGMVRDHPPRSYAEEAYVGTTLVRRSRLQKRTLIGCNMGFRREIVCRYRFEEALRYGCDEDEIAWRLGADGHGIAFAADAVVHHDHPYTVRGYLRTGFRQGQGSARYWYKKSTWIGRDLVFLTLALVSWPLGFVDAWLWLVPAGFLALQILALVYNQWVFKGKPLWVAVKVLPLEMLYTVCKAWGYYRTMGAILVGGEAAIRRSKREWWAGRRKGAAGASSG